MIGSKMKFAIFSPIRTLSCKHAGPMGFMFLYIVINILWLHAQTSISISDVWVNQAPPIVKVTAGFFNVHNSSDKPVSIVKITSPEFKNVEMHKSTINESMARMKLQDSIEVPANSYIMFKPGRYHLMLFQPLKKYKLGDIVKLSIHLLRWYGTNNVQARIRHMGKMTPHN